MLERLARVLRDAARDWAKVGPQPCPLAVREHEARLAALEREAHPPVQFQIASQEPVRWETLDVPASFALPEGWEPFAVRPGQPGLSYRIVLRRPKP